MGTLLYDGDCGFCTRVALALPGWGVRCEVEPMQSRDLAALGVDEQRARAELPYVAHDGAVTYGHLAFASALRTGNPVLRAMGAVIASPWLSPVAGGAYAWVADHRGQLSQWTLRGGKSG